MTYFCETFAFSDRNKRDNNQDICGYMIGECAPQSGGPNAAVFFVADGVSNANGDLAAKLIGKAIRMPLAQLLVNCSDILEIQNEAERTNEIHTQLCELIEQINCAVLHSAEHGNCCATISLALVLGSYVYTANLGDSPILLINLDPYDIPTGLSELYECQNGAGKAVKNGEITKEEALTDRRKDHLTVAVLGQQSLNRKDIHLTTAGLGQNNLLLLGSDGALSVLTDEKLMQLINEFGESGLSAINDALFDAVQNTVTADDNYTLLGQWIRTD